MPKLKELVREEGNRYSNSRNVPVMETLDREFNHLVNYCNELNNYASTIEAGGAQIQPGDNKKVMVSNNGLKWEKLTDEYVLNIDGDKIIDSSLDLSKLSGTTPNGVLVSNNLNKVICSLITSQYLNDSVITAAKLAANSVITEKIKNAAVTMDKLAENAVSTEKIVDLAVTTDKIANNAVTANKIANEVATKIERILDLPKIEIVNIQPAPSNYVFDQDYKNHILIIPALKYDSNFEIQMYKGNVPETRYALDGNPGARHFGMSTVIIVDNSNEDQWSFAHNLPRANLFIDIKLNKVYE